MKLELKHLAPYLPYGLNMTSSAKGRSAYITTLKRRLKKVEVLTPELVEVMIFLKRKPILRPLSDLTKEIEVNGKKFVPIEDVIMYSFGDIIENYDWLLGNPYIQIVQLFEWHFDVFGLIKQGLAIDINTLE